MFLTVAYSFVSRAMLVINLYRAPPYALSPSLSSFFIVLLVEPKHWRLLFLSEGHSIRMRFIDNGVALPVFTC